MTSRRWEVNHRVMSLAIVISRFAIMNGRWRKLASWVGVGIPSLLLASVISRAQPQGPTLTPQVSGTLNRLQAVSPVNSQVVWASGVGGTWALTTDGGETWESHVVPG